MIRWEEPFERAAEKLFERWGRKIYGNKIEKLEAQLKRIQSPKTARESYILAWKQGLEALFFGTVLLSLAVVASVGKPKAEERYQMKRPSYGEGNLETEVEALVEGESERLAVPITVKERQYTQKELSELFAAYEERLPELILGDNKSLDQVRSPLSLPDTLENGAISVSWYLEPSNYMNDQGEFEEEPPEEGSLVELCAILKYQEKEQEYRFFAKLYPREKTSEERLGQRLAEEAAREEERDPTAGEVLLPEEIDGKKIQWMTPGTPIVPLGAALLFVMIWYLLTKDEKKLKEKLEFRRRQMIMDYPMILYKMSMLLGAGMTIQGAFRKIAFHYKETRGNELHYAYEEMLNACYQMEKGTGEAAAYENFGQNCQDLRYIKFGSMLSQNLKKGSKGLSELLMREASLGMEERRNLARRMGEEAGVKLLLPMMLMLVLVMVILIVPSVLAF
ncbi:MAG TPA: type II secretion system F family protein [Candidatus Limivivens merdigallinarum]|uniref:Type II secretion system F family protein n=1 Tax=Candidatus Limivivens merdigallinarum TaxID=2840859 RepID=A0A9D0ZV09_9FIRM|nr:type II secretion system F family protein [Candidatus Limivivens merdigallinarum]